MLDALRELIERLARCDRAVRAIRARQVRSKLIREEVLAIVDHYFRGVRELALKTGIREDSLIPLDTEMHALLDVRRKSSTPATYRLHIRSISKTLAALEKSVLTASSKNVLDVLEPIDRRIIETLTRMLPSAAKSYEQATRDLQGPERLSWRGPAADLRESLRETLDHLAPDQAVISKPGFKLERDTSGPTMKQKMRHILRSRGLNSSQSQPPETAAETVEELLGSFVRSVYTRSSISAHTAHPRSEIVRIRDLVRAALCELLEIGT